MDFLGTKKIAQLFTEEEYISYSNFIQNEILNKEFNGSYVRIPQVGKYLKFNKFDFNDYKLLDSYDERERTEKVIYFYSNIPLQFFYEFTKEQTRVSERKVNPFAEDQVIKGNPEDISHFVPLETAVFTSLLKAKRAIIDQLMQRFLFNTDNKKIGEFDKVNIDLQFLYPSESYYFNSQELKLVISVRLKNSRD